ncbi:MAG: RNA polymerase sigma factor [Deltaproteobacteria bacterium]|nr:RNA polymerase sigma factor [Deltaproteobacteria bacterium]
MKTLSDFEEKLILKRALAKEAFSEIYDFYIIRIFRFIYLKTSSKETAEDLASEVFLKYWKRIKEGMEDESLGEVISNDKTKSFLYKIARNLIIDFYRKKEFPTVEIDSDIKDKIQDQKQDILAYISAKQEVEEMMEALRKLKGEYCEIIILRYVEELSILEIAEIIGKSSGSVRVQLHRATKALKSVASIK